MGSAPPSNIIEDYRFTICPDSDSLERNLILSDSSSRLARMQLLLSEFSFDVIHRAGIKHRAADALSRLVTKQSDTTPFEDDFQLYAIKTLDATDAVV